MCGEDGKVGAGGESLNKCSGFGAILFIRAGGCDVYRLVGGCGALVVDRSFVPCCLLI